MSTIEERTHIDDLTYRYYRAARYRTGYQRRLARAAITEPWNMAYEAMQPAAALIDQLAKNADAWYETGRSLDDFINTMFLGIDETTARPLWAALAAMEGTGE